MGGAERINRTMGLSNAYALLDAIIFVVLEASVSTYLPSNLFFAVPPLLFIPKTSFESRQGTSPRVVALEDRHPGPWVVARTSQGNWT